MRETLIHRPMVLAAIGLLLGVCTLQNMFAIALVVGALAFFRNVKACLICAAAFLLGAFFAPSTAKVFFPTQWLKAQATVIGVPSRYSNETIAEIRIANTNLLLSGPPDLPLALGETIKIQGDVQPLAEASQRLSDRGIEGRIWVERIQVIDPPPWPDRIGQSWRDSFIDFTNRSVDPSSAAVIQAVTFNSRSALSQNQKEEFSRAGTVHALSTSGLHVGLFMIVLFGLLSLLPIPRGVQIALVGVVLVLYAIASGLHPAVIRAAVVAILLCSAYLVRREPDLLSAIAVAVIVQMLWDASAIYDPGFQLTFTVLTAIALFMPFTPNFSRNRNPIAQKANKFLSRSAIAVIAAAPLTAYQFGTVSLISIGANAAIVLVLPVIVVGSMVAHLLSYLSLALGTGIMIAIVSPLSGWLMFVTDHFGGEWAALSVPAFSGYWVLLAYALMLIVWRNRLRPA